MSTFKHTPDLRIGEVGEFRFIKELLRFERARSLPNNWIGIGDDCAVLPLAEQRDLLVTTDSMVEGVHFDRSYWKASDIGWKLVATSVSDIAAMGGTPLACVVGIHLPATTEMSWLNEMYHGMNEALAEFHAFLIGGNTTQGHELIFSLTFIGESSGPRLLRSGAIEGDDLWVTGKVGLSRAALAKLLAKAQPTSEESIRFFRPQPRFRFVQQLRSSIHAAIDLSDGLLQDLSHLAMASNVRIELDETPIREKLCHKTDRVPFGELITGGEDYEVAFTAAESARSQIEAGALEHQLPCARIGRVLSGSPGLVAPQATELGQILAASHRGFDHFRTT